MKLNTFKLLLCSVFIFVACSDKTPDIVEPPIDETTKYLFTVETGSQWLLKNENNDSAFFQAFDTTVISVANVFWDTSAANREEMEAVRVRFRYWEGNMRKDIWFAFGITDSGYIFCADRNFVISEFQLDGFYLKLFFIPNDVQDGMTEFISETFGTANYTVSTESQWKNIDEIFWQEEIQKLWRVEYKSIDEMKIPQQYFYEFDFLENVGFYNYMNYKLVSKLQLNNNKK